MTEWILLRAAGIGAYVALFLSVAWGLVSSTGVVTKRVSKPASNQFHAVVASTGLALLGVHMVLLVVDSFMPFGAAGLAGATAVQVGTANFINPRATLEVIAGIEAYLARHGIGDVKEIVGKLEGG
jgi:hypothetical protein